MIKHQFFVTGIGNIQHDIFSVFSKYLIIKSILQCLRRAWHTAIFVNLEQGLYTHIFCQRVVGKGILFCPAEFILP